MNKYLTMGNAVEILKGANARFDTYTNSDYIRLEIQDTRIEDSNDRYWNIQDDKVINAHWEREVKTPNEFLEELQKQLNK